MSPLLVRSPATASQSPSTPSLCAFSGLEDWVSPDKQPPGGIDVQPGVVQNWGHVKRAFGLTGGANSVQTPFGEEGCNAHLYPAR